MPPDSDPAPRSHPYSGSGGGDPGFRGVGGDLLRIFPPLAADAAPAGAADASPAIDPTAPDFGSHGTHLLAPLRPGPDASRLAACPVCVTAAAVPASAGGWVPLRCETCGTEFVATDGRTPPPAPAPVPPPPPVRIGKPKTYPLLEIPFTAKPPKPTGLLVPMLPGSGAWRLARCPVCHSLETVSNPGGWVHLRCGSCGTEFTATDGTAPPTPPAPPPPTPTAEIERRNLARWVATGEADRWVAHRRASWTEKDFSRLLESLVVAGLWPIDPAGVRRALDDAAVRYRTADLPRSKKVYTLSGIRYALCPHCRDRGVMVPGDVKREARLLCPGCGKRFLVDVPAPPPPKSSPPPGRKSSGEVRRVLRELRSILPLYFGILGLVLFVFWLSVRFYKMASG